MAPNLGIPVVGHALSPAMKPKFLWSTTTVGLVSTGSIPAR